MFYATLSYNGTPIQWVAPYSASGALPERLSATGLGIGIRNAFEVRWLGQQRIALRTIDELLADSGHWVRPFRHPGLISPGFIGKGNQGPFPEPEATFRLIPLTDDSSVFALQTFQTVRHRRRGRRAPADL